MIFSGLNLPRGGLKRSNLPSARKVSWDLHHDVFKFGKFPNVIGTDPTCPSEMRFDDNPNSQFSQQCPNGTDKSTGARLGGNGDLATHMVGTIFSNLVTIGPTCSTTSISSKRSITSLQVMQFGQFVAHSLSMTHQQGVSITFLMV